MNRGAKPLTPARGGANSRGGRSLYRRGLESAARTECSRFCAAAGLGLADFERTAADRGGEAGPSAT